MRKLNNLKKATGIVLSTMAFATLIGIVAIAPIIERNAPTFAAQTPVSGEISGSVFRDLSSDGAQAGLENGVENITVTAYDDSGMVATAVTDSQGDYTLIGLTDSTTYRIEFSNLPSYLEPSTTGANNSTTVAFAASPAVNIDLAVHNPADYCQSNPDLATTCFVAGDQTLGLDALVSIPYQSGTTDNNSNFGISSPAPNHIALDNEVGAIWGLAFHRQTQSIFASAFTKRHVGYGPNGIGAIYQVDPNTQTTSLFVDFNSLFPGSVGVDTHTPADYESDNNVWDSVGKTAFGDLEISEDEQTLYVINLYDRKLYDLPIGDTAVPPTSANITTITLPDPGTGPTGCPAHPSTPAGELNLNLRPGALSASDGNIYVSLTCTAESTQNANDLRGFVYAFDPATTNFTQVANFPLNYGRGCSTWNGSTCGSANWQAWATTQQQIYFSPYDQYYYPQPWVTDIEFDENGFMILGIGDRYGHQSGNDKNGSGAVEGVSAGDILRFEPTATGWEMENNGTSGGVTTGGANNGEGPGGGEFYWHERYNVLDDTPGHAEIALGGIVHVPGSGEIVSGAFDPAPSGDYRAGGIIWLDNTTGERTRSYQLFARDANATFGKAAGIGDLELLCDSAPIEIGNYVWNDANGNGIQDPSESPIENATVTLYDMDNGGAVVGTAVTDVNGNYFFGGLANTNMSSGALLSNRNYELRISLGDTAVSAYTLTQANANGISTNDNKTDSTDSDAIINGGDAVIAFATGGAGQNNHTLDFGFTQSATLGDLVWFDVNGNGIQDGGEAGVQGVSVTLYDATNTAVFTTTTDASGNYLFTNLTPGVYSLGFTPPAGYALSPQDQGADNAIDSDADPVNGRTAPTTLLGGQNDLTWDAGLYQLPSLGSFVWLDSNADGIQDGGEAGVSGATVELLVNDGTGTFIPAVDGSGTAVSSQLTAADGLYYFDNLPAGDYRVRVTPPAGLYPTATQNTADNDNSENDSNIATQPIAGTYESGTFTLAVGGQPTEANTFAGDNQDNANETNGNMTIDFGFVPGASIGDFVWNDINFNGIQDGGETGIDGVTVTLYNGAGVITSTTTSGGGLYSFDNLEPGDYYVEFTLPSGYVISPQDQGADDTADSDVNPANGQTVTTTLTAGENDTSWDLGIYEVASLGDFVWLDSNANGIQDGGETGIDGITVTLYLEGTGPISTTTTSGGGLYSFDNLNPGSYYLEITVPADYTLSPQDQGADDTADSDFSPTTFQTTPALLTPSENDPTWDAGLYQTASLGDFVWEDSNGNGIQDGGEPGLDGVTVTLYNGAGAVISTTTTAGGGLYSFDNLQPGDYYVEFTPTAGYNATPQDQGADDAIDSDANPTSGQTAITTLISGENDPTWDAGFYQTTSFGNVVWLDDNANGILDGGEAGVPNIIVTLYTSAGAINTTTTDANGNFIFDNLPPGDYWLEYTLPDGYILSPQDQGADDTVDSDVDPATGTTAPTTLTSGENDLTWFAGLYQAASIGNFVWLDSNSNGTQDGGETGVSGVTVTLYDSAGAVISTTTTNASGNYLFNNLVPGEYSVEFTLPAGYEFSPQDQGGDDAVDSDGDGNGRTINTTLTAGENDLTWDTGIYQPASLGDFVWLDTNANGIQDGGETGIDGVTVTLYDGTGAVISTTTTAGGGLYSFNDLPPGEYTVGIDLPAGYQHSPSNQGADDTADSDINPATGRTGQTTLDSSENDPTWDAGIYQLASLGDFVWDDLNADGIQDGGEPGIGGITVTLYLSSTGAIVSATTTDANGAYSFDNLIPGDYYVEFTPPAGYLPSPQDAGADDTADSDANPLNGRTTPTTLISGQNDPTWDAGYYQPASIGDTVWLDSNADGIFDSGETGIDGITVTLHSSDGTVLSTTMTTGGGTYLFDGLTPDDYYLTFTPPAGYTLSPQDAGADDTADSDADPANGQTATTTLISGENDLTWFAGVYQPASIGNFVWEDSNANGIQDGGETGISGVQVSLILSGTGVIDTTTTDANGNYSFDGLTPDTYAVEFTLPAGYQPSPQDAGADDTADSDADTNTGQTIFTTLTSGENDPSWDAGVYQTASLGDFVWLDSNANGIQDAGETGIDGITVTLYDSTGPLTTTTTSGGGLYTFDNLTPGDYYVGFDLPAGYFHSPADEGSDDTADSDADTTTGLTTSTTIDSNENDPTWDAGIYQLASLGNFVWEDANADGIQDGGEAGIPGITVTLYLSSTGAIVDTTTTDANGEYSFTDLTPGDYYVGFAPPANYTASPQDAGADDTADSDASPSNTTAPFTLESGENDLTIDAGFYEVVGVGNFVWLDLDADGIQDGGEPGIPNVTVNLHLNSTGAVISSTTTNANGEYFFENLPPGDYYLDFTPPADHFVSPQDQGADNAVDSDIDPTTGETTSINIPIGTYDLTWDAGLYQLAEIGDTVWLDTNADGIMDSGENGLAGITVTLYLSGTGAISTAVTDSNGNYLFDDLTPGDYWLEFELPDEYEISPQDQGSDNSVDSDVDPATGTTDPTLLTSGESDLTWFAGVYQPASLGDTVWLDSNSNGIQDGGEAGVSGITVTLYLDGTGPIASTTTNGSGNYSFDNLTPGDYYVEFSLPDGYVITTQDAGADDTADSDANPATGQTIVTTLVSGENDPTWDAGIYQYASIGDYVWLDVNANGIQDSGESGVSGVEVTLYLDGTGAISTTTTNALGGYSFDLLPPGDYQVGFTLPSGYEISPQDQGSNNAVDSDVDPATGLTAVTTLDSSEDDPTWDLGIYEPVSIGSYVWVDANGDGTQDGSESGVSGADVFLLVDDGTGSFVPAVEVDGTAVTTQTTGADGLYFFDNLPPGTYKVQVTPPAGMIPTLSQTSADDASGETDSNIADEPSAGTFESGAFTLTTNGEPVETDTADGDNADAANDNDGNMTVDFGFIEPVSIGSFVWVDADGDGIQDGAEVGIENAVVELLVNDGAGNFVPATTVDGTAVLSQTTATNGHYFFDNLPPGQYIVQVTPPNTYLPAAVQNGANNDDADNDSNIASEPIPGTYQSGAFIITTDGEPVESGSYEGDDADNANSNDGNMTIDFAFTKPTSIGSYVWLDADGDGNQDASESGIANAVVALFVDGGTGNFVPATTIDGTAVSNQVTAADGLYFFDNLPPGDYKVQVTPPADYLPTLPQTAVDNNNDVNDSNIASEPSTGTYESGVFTLVIDGEPDETGTFDGDNQDSFRENDGNMTVDFGFIEPVSIGSYVWIDTNNNGLQDGGETPVTGAEVALFLDDGAGNFVPATTIDGAAVPSQTTSPIGLYFFDNLPPGSYRVQVTPPAGLAPSQFQTAVSNNDAENDSNIASEPVAGTYESGTFSLTVDGEPVESGPLAGDNQDDGNEDSGNMTVDFGFVPQLSLGSLVWEDVDGSGTQDGGEPGIAGAQVALFVDDGTGNFVPAIHVDGTAVTSQPTLADGTYHFENLPPGDYKVQVTPPAGYTPTYNQNSASNDDSENDSNIAAEPVAGTYESGTFTLSQNGEPTETDSFAGDDQDNGNDANGNMTIDFGFFQPVAIGNVVWIDDGSGGGTFLNGILDGAEQGVPNILVELYRAGDTPDVDGPFMSTSTNADGEYLFDMIPQGDYFVHLPSSEFEPNEPLGSFVSSPGNGGDDATDDNGDENGIDENDLALNGISSEVISLTSGGEPTGETGQGTYSGTLPDSSANMTVDFGFFELLSLGNIVWFDENNDSLLNSGEVGVPAGVIIRLLDGNSNPVTNPATGQPYVTTTTAGGFYEFTHLYPGDYVVEIAPVNFQSGGALQGYISSSGSVDPDVDASDIDDNGVDGTDPAIDGIRTLPVTLDYDSEPDNFDDTDDNDNTNLTIDLGVVIDPTAVSLTSFTATDQSEGTILLNWSTADEIDNFGFNIYRSQVNDFASATEVHFEPTAVSGGTGPGSSYSYQDTVPSFGTWYYWLVDVETDGDTKVHPVIQVSASNQFQIFLPEVMRP